MVTYLSDKFHRMCLAEIETLKADGWQIQAFTNSSMLGVNFYHLRHCRSGKLLTISETKDYYMLKRDGNVLKYVSNPYKSECYELKKSSKKDEKQMY